MIMSPYSDGAAIKCFGDLECTYDEMKDELLVERKTAEVSRYYYFECTYMRNGRYVAEYLKVRSTSYTQAFNDVFQLPVIKALKEMWITYIEDSEDAEAHLGEIRKLSE